MLKTLLIKLDRNLEMKRMKTMMAALDDDNSMTMTLTVMLW